ncbi:MAG: hypothetical protein H0W30_05260 [Gemmatimonadaceae bacterium]|nr:hypothetical protein [Gemmatimonadaceae bacterium]
MTRFARRGCRDVVRTGGRNGPELICVNDDPKIMMELIAPSAEGAVRPYYRYMADQVAGGEDVGEGVAITGIGRRESETPLPIPVCRSLAVEPSKFLTAGYGVAVAVMKFGPAGATAQK